MVGATQGLLNHEATNLHCSSAWRSRLRLCWGLMNQGLAGFTQTPQCTFTNASHHQICSLTAFPTLSLTHSALDGTFYSRWACLLTVQKIHSIPFHILNFSIWNILSTCENINRIKKHHAVFIQFHNYQLTSQIYPVFIIQEEVLEIIMPDYFSVTYIFPYTP